MIILSYSYRRDFSLLFSIALFAPLLSCCFTVHRLSSILTYLVVLLAIFYRSAICGTLILCCFAVVWFGPVMMVIFIILPLLLHILSLVSLTYHRTILLLLHKLLPNNLNTLQNVTVAATIATVNALFPDMASSSNLSTALKHAATTIGLLESVILKIIQQGKFVNFDLLFPQSCCPSRL